ncbi:alpha/beta hydrolase [Thermobifida halotolerans]|uniref:Alpha/beta hydrolase n=1 Tax=Thermobifida halotolerans TaxID=483545 RepID=A0A399G1L0_9ACTN|nr:alpha/beta hydrolase [Thermobifida halotolerans]UOE20931.1 alpha/beta hydrolase [Thermobifida halotolerans]
MAIANSNGVSIYYEVHGTGPAVLLVHGSGGHHAAWWQQVAELRDRYTVVTMDLRGFGNSDSSMTEFDSWEFPDDIIAVLDAEDLSDVLLVGQSIGAVVALRAAMRRPDRVGGVALAHSLGGINHPELTELVAADRAEAVKLPVIDRLLSRDFQKREPARTFLFQQMGTFNVAKMADLRNLSTGGPTIDEIAAARIPVCFLAGENDAVLSAATVRRAHELLPGSRLELIPGAPHSMYWEAPELFNAAVIRIRDGLTQRKATA